MQRGTLIGKLFDIEIRLDSSWYFIFFLIIWNLASAFGSLHPGWSVILRWGSATLAALLFFASVLAHEFAHSLMAKAQGVNVRTITLHLFGGISNIERHPPSPRAEFLITIVGPLTSFVLGIVFSLLSGVSTGELGAASQRPGALIGGLGPLPTMLLWLGSINIILAVFNLIPGFPLDGGRVLRSILWTVSGSLTKATRWASTVGQGIAWLFILGGISMIFGFRIPFFGSGLVSGLWLAFIGWFLNNASAASYQQILIQDVLEGVPVKRMMRRDPPAVPPDIRLDELVDNHVMASDERAFPVLEDDRLVGIITIEDIRKVARSNWPHKRVDEVMTPAARLESVGPDDPSYEAISRMQRIEVSQLPVLDDRTLIGMLRHKDILRWLELQGELESER